MRFIRGLIVAALLAVGIVSVLVAPTAHACSCAVGGTQAERDAAAPIIVNGKVIKETHYERSDFQGEYEFLVDIDEVVKGEVEDPAAMWSTDQSSLCGRRLTLGERYRLYPTRAEDGRLRIHLCDGTQQLDESETVDSQPTPTTSRAPPSTTVAPTTTVAAATTTSTSSTTTLLTSTTLSPPAEEYASTPPTISASDESGSDSAPPVLVTAAGVALVAAAAATGVAVFRRRSLP